MTWFAKYALTSPILKNIEPHSKSAGFWSHVKTLL